MEMQVNDNADKFHFKRMVSPNKTDDIPIMTEAVMRKATKRFISLVVSFLRPLDEFVEVA